MRKTFSIGLGLVLCLGGNVGFAASAAAASANGLTLSVLAEAADYTSTEFRSGRVFNWESGILNGPSLRAEYARGGWHVGLLQRQLSGMIYYVGQTQFGVPIVSHTDLHYSQSGVSATYEFENLPMYVGLAWRTRKVDRYIEPTVITQALHETLRQTEWGPIIGARWRISNKLTEDVRLMALVTTSSTLSVDFLGTYDAGELSMPRNWCQEFQFGLRYRMSAAYGFLARVSYQHFSPTVSDYAFLTKNGVVVGRYYYPGSSQDLTVFSVGAYVHW